MSKKISDEQKAELESLYQRVLVIYQFFMDDSKGRKIPDHLRELERKKAELNGMLGVTIEATYKRNDLRGMKMITRDFNEIIDGYPEAKREKLEERLKEANL